MYLCGYFFVKVSFVNVLVVVDFVWCVGGDDLVVD